MFMPGSSKPPYVEVSHKEISRALDLFCRVAQKQAFPDEYDSLNKGNGIKDSSKLKCLSPFMGNDNLIKVGGRLKNSTLPYDACHQDNAAKPRIN